jgi:hypothetical protein
MSAPYSKEREAELQAKLEHGGYTGINHEAISREIMMIKLHRLQEKSWYKSPTFWVAALGTLASWFLVYAALSQSPAHDSSVNSKVGAAQSQPKQQ